MKRNVLITQSCATLCDPMDWSPPAFSVHGILQARKLEWVAFPFSRGSSWLRDRTQVSCIAGRCFTGWATREVPWKILWTGGLGVGSCKGAGACLVSSCPWGCQWAPSLIRCCPQRPSLPPQPVCSLRWSPPCVWSSSPFGSFSPPVLQNIIQFILVTSLLHTPTLGISISSQLLHLLPPSLLCAIGSFSLSISCIFVTHNHHSYDILCLFFLYSSCSQQPFAAFYFLVASFSLIPWHSCPPYLQLKLNLWKT